MDSFTSGISLVEVSQDDAFVYVVGTESDTVFEYCIATRELESSVTPKPGVPVTAIALIAHSFGDVLVYGLADGSVNGYSGSAPNSNFQCENHIGPVTSLQIQNGYVFSGGSDSRVLAHRLGSGRFATEVHVSSPVSKMTSTQTAMYIGTLSGNIIKFTLNRSNNSNPISARVNPRTFDSAYGSVTGLCVNDNESFLFVSHAGHSFVRVWDVHTHTCVRVVSFESIVSGITRGPLVYCMNGTVHQFAGTGTTEQVYDSGRYVHSISSGTRVSIIDLFDSLQTVAILGNNNDNDNEDEENSNNIEDDEDDDDEYATTTASDSDETTSNCSDESDTIMTDSPPPDTTDTDDSIPIPSVYTGPNNVFYGHSDGISCIAGNYSIVFTGSYDKTISQWNTRSRKRTIVYKLLQVPTALVYDFRSRLLYVLSGKNTISVYDTVNTTCVLKDYTVLGTVVGMEFESSGNGLYVGVNTRRARPNTTTQYTSKILKLVFDTLTSKFKTQEPVLVISGTIKDFALVNNGRGAVVTLASNIAETRVYSPSFSCTPTTIPQTGFAVVCEKYLYLYSHNRQTVSKYEYSTNKFISILDCKSGVTCLYTYADRVYTSTLAGKVYSFDIHTDIQVAEHTENIDHGDASLSQFETRYQGVSVVHVNRYGIHSGLTNGILCHRLHSIPCSDTVVTDVSTSVKAAAYTIKYTDVTFAQIVDGCLVWFNKTSIVSKTNKKTLGPITAVTAGPSVLYVATENSVFGLNKNFEKTCTLDISKALAIDYCDGSLYIATAGNLVRIDTSDPNGALTHEFKTPLVSRPLFVKASVSYVYIVDVHGAVYTFNVENGRSLKVCIPSNVNANVHADVLPSCAYMSSNDLVVGYSDGTIMLYPDHATHLDPEIVFESDDLPSALASNGKTLLVGTSIGSVFCLERLDPDSYEFEVVEEYTSHFGPITSLVTPALPENVFVSTSKDGTIRVQTLTDADADADNAEPEFEEDSTVFKPQTYTRASILDYTYKDCLKNVINQNPITLEEYTLQDLPIFVHIPNSKNVFEKVLCTTRDELLQYSSAIESLNVSRKQQVVTSCLMCIQTAPLNPVYQDDYTTGISGKPTNRLLVKLPMNNMLVTLGSFERLMDSNPFEKWYAMPLYGGKRRRIGNVNGFFGMGFNHGQIPGHVVYKLYRERDFDESDSGITPRETPRDYPMYLSSEELGQRNESVVDAGFVRRHLHGL